QRHRAGAPAAARRAVLHHQGAGRGARAGSVSGVPLRRRSRRPVAHRVASRRRHRRAPGPAARAARRAMTSAVSEPASVLIVDDDATYRTAIARALERRGYAVHTAESVAEALARLPRTRIDYASIDLRMPGASGLELVRHIKASQPAAVVVVLTSYGSIATAVEAMKL